LYESFEKYRGKLDQEIISLDEKDATKQKQSGDHVFQALQYLRKLCSHPSLVLTQSHPEYDAIMKWLKDENKDINDISNAPKLLALKYLLKEAGIGTKSTIPQIVVTPIQVVIVSFAFPKYI
jgi:TATA-binding protein-associated factor